MLFSGVANVLENVYTNHKQGGPYIIANLYCIYLREHETCVQADAVQICGNI